MKKIYCIIYEKTLLFIVGVDDRALPQVLSGIVNHIGNYIHNYISPFDTDYVDNYYCGGVLLV